MIHDFRSNHLDNVISNLSQTNVCNKIVSDVRAASANFFLTQWLNKQLFNFKFVQIGLIQNDILIEIRKIFTE